MSNRNRNSNLGPVLMSFTAILAVAAMIFETVAILFGYDPVMCVFKIGSKAATASVAAHFIIGIATVTLAICVGKLQKMKSNAQENGLADVLSSVGGFALVISSAIEFIEMIRVIGTKELAPIDIFTVLLLVVSIPTAVYFFMGTDKTDKRTTALAFFPPIFPALCLIRLYFVTRTAINDPVRVLFQITLVTVMLALLYELKLRVKGTGGIMFTVTASLATVLSSSAFMAKLLLYVTVKVGSAADLLLALGTLLISLYLLLRLGGYYSVSKEEY